MRKTRIRRRIRKRSGKTRKTSRNIHKSKKHKNSRRYSRRHMMRGGGESPSDFFHFNQDTVLLGYGYIQDRSNEYYETFILYSNSDKKFYFYDNENKSIVYIDYVNPIIEKLNRIERMLPGSIEARYAQVDLTVGKYVENINRFFNSNNIITNIIDTDVTIQINYPPINIIIGGHTFSHFNIAHQVVHDKKVLFARLHETGQFQFIFRDKDGSLSQNRYKLIEKKSIRIHDYIGKITNPETIILFNEAHEEYRKKRIR